MTISHDRDEDDYFVCPNCGAELSVEVTFCRHCGASNDAGWGEDENPSDPDLSADWDDDPDFDYEDFLAREFPEHARTRSRRPRSRWLLLAAIALLCIALLLLGSIC